MSGLAEFSWVFIYVYAFNLLYHIYVVTRKFHGTLGGVKVVLNF